MSAAKAKPATSIRYETLEEEEDTAYIEMKLREAAEAWPAHESRPDPDTVLDAAGPWGLHARGAEVRPCENVQKGFGAFATRPIAAGAVLGVYYGEKLTMRQHALRHGWRLHQDVQNATKQEQRELAKREQRLASLTFGQPWRGAKNGSSYCFSLFPEALKDALGPVTLPGRVAYIDCEDPNLSTWCRYINHAPDGDPACNAVPRCNAMEHLVWLEATRDIARGEEIQFDYGEQYKWDDAPEKS